MAPRPGRELFHHAHYNMLAKRIRELRTEYDLTKIKQEFGLTSNTYYRAAGANEVLDTLQERLAEWFEGDNPRFECDLWNEACTPRKVDKVI